MISTNEGDYLPENPDICRSKVMRKLLLVFGLALCSQIALGQGCVTIESILVDACTLGSGCNNSSAPTCNCEGKNEMMRFRIGNQSQNVNSLTINWPNNAFQGICQDAQTAQNTAELNATIEACGYLVEPVNGVLPANSQVLIVTSADMCTASNSFANLSDTLYVIYQCPGNYMGHFANFGSGFRTTTVSFGGGCTNTASYNRALLVDQFGGNSAQDGATVDFPATGGPIYYNNGCTAPVPQETVDAGDDSNICPDAGLQLNGTLIGDFTDWYWSGGTGSFANPNSLNTTYTPGVGDSEGFSVVLNAVNCNGTVSDSLHVFVLVEEVVDVLPVGTIEICPGESATLTASGNGTITWSNGQTGNSITVSNPGTYVATLNGECGTTQDSVLVTQGNAPALTVLPGTEVTICDGGTTTLTAIGDGTFSWSTGETTDEITVSAAGTYTVELTNSCGTSDETITVSIQEPPVVSLVSPAEVSLCEGQSITLEAAGIGDFEWNTGETTPTITVSATGTYTVTLSNACGNDEIAVVVIDGGTVPELVIDVIGNTSICAGESVILVASGASNYQWSNGSTENEIEVYLPGLYNLTATNSCGSTTVSVQITQNTTPLVHITQGAEAAICGGGSLTLTASSTLPITWSTGHEGALIEVDGEGVYYAFVSNVCGSDTAFIDVAVGNPEASFTASADTGSAPLDVQFFNTSVNADNYNWYINGELVGTDVDLALTFYQNGPQEVTLIAIDDAGCTDSFSMIINISDCYPLVFVPNTFTPNEDGINDLFKFTANCVESYELNIYNRWGTLLFTGEKGSPFWDGSNRHGYYVADGVYIYTIAYTSLLGVKTEKSGTITIFR